jgi:hypothetical protein
MQLISTVIAIGVVAITGQYLLGMQSAEAQSTSIGISDLGFEPTGWSGDKSYIISFREDWPDNPRSGTTCTRVEYNPSTQSERGDGWAGVYWQYPPNNWGNMPGKYLTGAKEVTFWARGELGGEKAEFKVGGITGDSLGSGISTGEIGLQKTWNKYTIPLLGKDLSNIKAGFFWASYRDENPSGCIIYLDDITYIF